MMRALILSAAALAFALPAAAQDVAIVNATLVIGDGSAPIEGGSVIVRGGKVVAAGDGVVVPAGMERIDAEGAWVGGEHHPLDVLVIASGFEVGTSHARRSGYDVRGRDGVLLSEKWSEGMRSLHGIHAHGFPNLFIIGFAQGFDGGFGVGADGFDILCVHGIAPVLIGSGLR